MGLDQYMWKKKYGDIYDFSQKAGSAQAKSVKIKTEITFENGNVKTQEYEIKDPQHSFTILLPVAYWRKANAIHRWILEHTGQAKDDCHKIYLSKRTVQALVDDCKAVLEDHNKAEELLPTQDGFFFGSTEYDEYYYEDLKNTVKMLEPELQEEHPIEGDGFVYQASW